MNEQLLHTPEGVRDIYGSEFVKKFELQQTLFDVMNSYGYQGIETPTFEFFDVFGKEVGTVPSNELYKFRQYCKALGKEASQLTNNELESYYLNNV